MPLLFGMPIEEAGRAAEDGRLVLAGCIMPPGEPPNWACANHHRWRHGLDEDHQSLITSILRSYRSDDGVEAT